MLDEIARAQERLALALDRARASEDRELAARVRDEGFQLVQQWSGLLRMAHLHSLDNRAFDQPVTDVGRSLVGLLELLGTLTLVVVEDQLYLNEIRIRADERGGGRELGGELARHAVGGLRVHRPLSEKELRSLVACFARKPAEQAPRAALSAALEQERVLGLELLGPYRVRLSGDVAEPQTAGLEAAARASQAVTEAFDNLGRGRLFNPLPARRAVTELLKERGAPVTPAGLLPHQAHALSVCRLALRLGRELGLSEGLLQDLGVAALLHDVGYAQCDEQGRPSPPAFGQHASMGARLLLRQRGFHISKIRRVAAVLGHHEPARPSHGAGPALLARVLRIAEDFDALTARARLPVAQALGRMASAAGTLYDAAVLQALVNLQLGGAQPAPTEAPLEVALVAPQAPQGASPVAAPAARSGTISQGVPIRVMHDLLLEQHTGRLVCAAGTERRELYLARGQVVGAASTRREHALPTLLLRAELVELESLEWALEQQRSREQPLGRVLVEASLLPPEQLEHALLQRARAVVVDLCEWEDGQYFVDTAAAPPDLDLSTRLSTDELIAGAVRQLHDPDVVRFSLGDLARVPVLRGERRRPAALALLRPDEGALLARVDGSTSAGQLLAASGLPAPEAQQALLMLLALGLVDYRKTARKG